MSSEISRTGRSTEPDVKNDIAPRVFISHASEDKERFVLGFAERLLATGIDAWLDKWEIAAGDSIVQRIFSVGIAGADAFLIVLSSTSVEKPWVQAELDAGVIRNIEENSRLIVIRLDEVEVPMVLRAKKWVTIRNLTSYDVELQEIVDTIFGNEVKPALGTAPAYSSLPNVAGLNSQDSAVLRILVEDAIDADTDVAMSAGLLQRVTSIGISEASFRVSLSALKNASLIDFTELTGNYRTPAVLRPSAWSRMLPSLYPNLSFLQRQLVGLLVNEFPNGVSSEELASKLDLPRRVVIILLRELGARRLVSIYEAMPNICGVMKVNVDLLSREL